MDIVMVRFLDCALVSPGFPLAANAALGIARWTSSTLCLRTMQAALGATVYNFSLGESSRGASVTGISGDGTKTLSRFSVQWRPKLREVGWIAARRNNREMRSRQCTFGVDSSCDDFRFLC
jgi:hypothetical protein